MNHVATICEVVNGFRIMHGTVRAVLRAVMKLPTHQIILHDPGGAEAGDGAGVVPGVGLSMAASLLIILGLSPKIKNSSGIGYINQLKPVKTS